MGGESPICRKRARNIAPNDRETQRDEKYSEHGNIMLKIVHTTFFAAVSFFPTPTAAYIAARKSVQIRSDIVQKWVEGSQCIEK